MMFKGMEIIESVHLVVSGPPMEIVRTWSERLMSWPWRPWQRVKIVATQTPDPNFYRIGSGKLGRPKLLAHPATVQRLRDTLGSEGQDAYEAKYYADEAHTEDRHQAADDGTAVE